MESEEIQEPRCFGRQLYRRKPTRVFWQPQWLRTASGVGGLNGKISIMCLISSSQYFPQPMTLQEIVLHDRVKFLMDYPSIDTLYILEPFSSS